MTIRLLIFLSFITLASTKISSCKLSPALTANKALESMAITSEPSTFSLPTKIKDNRISLEVDVRPYLSEDLRPIVFESEIQIPVSKQFLKAAGERQFGGTGSCPVASLVLAYSSDGKEWKRFSGWKPDVVPVQEGKFFIRMAFSFISLNQAPYRLFDPKSCLTMKHAAYFDVSKD